MLLPLAFDNGFVIDQISDHCGHCEMEILQDHWDASLSWIGAQCAVLVLRGRCPACAKEHSRHMRLRPDSDGACAMEWSADGSDWSRCEALPRTSWARRIVRLVLGWRAALTSTPGP